MADTRFIQLLAEYVRDCLGINITGLQTISSRQSNMTSLRVAGEPVGKLDLKYVSCPIM